MVLRVVKISSGLVAYRFRPELQVLLVHPGGPLFQNKDVGGWSIPKGEAAEGEDLLQRAIVEFKEEVGWEARGPFVPIGDVTQKGGKRVHAWATNFDPGDPFETVSNTFEMEWPPRSGRLQVFPEVDRAEFFPLQVAREKMNVAQVAFLDRLEQLLQG